MYARRGWIYLCLEALRKISPAKLSLITSFSHLNLPSLHYLPYPFSKSRNNLIRKAEKQNKSSISSKCTGLGLTSVIMRARHVLCPWDFGAFKFAETGWNYPEHSRSVVKSRYLNTCFLLFIFRKCASSVWCLMLWAHLGQEWKTILQKELCSHVGICA